MAEYLGEFQINLAEHAKFSTWTAADFALIFIEKYGQTDGSHHKQWVLDQVARILLGTPVCVTLARWDDGTEEERFFLEEPSQDYWNWVESMLGEEYADGSREFGYDEGIAP